MTSNLPQITDEYCLKEFGWTQSQFEVVKRTYFNNLSTDEIKIFAHVCKHTKLDPFLKQIYPVMRQGKMTIQTAIDGYRAIAERTGRYSPGREPTFVYDKNGMPISSTAYIKKMTADGTWHEVAATAFFSEYNPGVGPFWKKMPHTMIAKCAEALALRKAFPSELSAVYTKDEMDQAGNPEKLPEIECEDLTKSDTNMDHHGSAPNLSQHQEDKVTQEQFEEIVQGLEMIDELTLKRYHIHMEKEWLTKAGDYKNLPSRAFAPTMTAIQRNIEMNAKKVG